MENNYENVTLITKISWIFVATEKSRDFSIAKESLQMFFDKVKLKKTDVELDLGSIVNHAHGKY